MIEPYGKVEKLSDVQGSFSSLNTAVMKFILMFWVDLRYRYPFAYTMDYRMAVKINRRTSQLSDERLLFKMSLVRRWTTRSPLLSVSNCVCCVSGSSSFRVLRFSVDKCGFGKIVSDGSEVTLRVKQERYLILVLLFYWTIDARWQDV